MNIAGKKVAYITLGCKLNFSETSTIRHSLEKEGTETVADKEGADIFVINTCSVTDMAEKKGRQLIRKIIHHNPGAYIIVVGCYAQLRAKEIMAIDGVSLVLGAGEKFNVAHYLQHLEEQEKQEPHSCDIFKISNFDLAYSFGDRTRCFLKIQTVATISVLIAPFLLPAEEAGVPVCRGSSTLSARWPAKGSRK